MFRLDWSATTASQKTTLNNACITQAQFRYVSEGTGSRITHLPDLPNPQQSTNSKTHQPKTLVSITLNVKQTYEALRMDTRNAAD